MKKQDNPALREILLQATELPPDERGPFLASACAGKPDLRAEVEGLIRSLQADDDLLREPTMAPGGFRSTIIAEGDARPPHGERAGERIGRYKLLQLIGEGGFGSVFMAEQETPVVRKVALKIIKLGMDTKQIIARFEAERQALALMDHPNIARVLDAGATDSGRPYFVMELVRGVPITTFCDANKLTTRQRLELFVPVCSALQHAHQKGIIHRDLKPTNVLVTMHDDKPVPKIIDFGVAKAINQRLTEHTLFTEYRQLVGTPAYMSPEQAQMSGLDMDTRSDIYSLGVLLYELLTGTTPFDAKHLRAAAYEEMQRIIREVEPPKASTRLSTLAAGTLTAVADQRRCDPATLSRALEGDLDWIMMKCLEKDRARRYETANGLARDIQRYLNDEPVEASPPSATYRLKKLVRKHKREAVAIGAVIAALMLGILGTSVGLARARHNLAETQNAELRAETNLSAARAAERMAQQSAHEMKIERDIATANEVKAREASQREQSARQHAELVSQLLENTFGTDVLIRQLERLYDAQKANGRASETAIIVAHELATAYNRAAREPDAVKLLEQVRPDAIRTWGFGGWNTLVMTYDLMHFYENTGQNDSIYKLAEQIREPVTQGFDRDPARFEPLILNLAAFYGRVGRVDEASRMAEHIRQVAIDHFGAYDAKTIAITSALIDDYWYWGRTDDAINLAKRSRRSAAEKFGVVDDPRTLPLTIELAWLMAKSDRLDDGIALAEPARKAAMLALGPEDSNTKELTHQLTWLYTRIGRTADATKLRQELWPLELKEKNHDIQMNAVDPQLLVDRGWLYKKMGQSEEASADFRQAMDLATDQIRQQTTNSGLAAASSCRGGLLARMGRFKEALADYRKAVESAPENCVYWHDNGLVPVLLQVGDLEGYRHWRSLELRRFRDTSVPVTAHRVAKDALAAPLDDDDLKIALELAERGSRLQGHFKWDGEQTKGMAEYRAGRFDQAIPQLRKCAEAMENGNRDQTQCLLFLAMAYEHLGMHADALASLEKARLNFANYEPNDMGDCDGIIAESALREAEALINARLPTTRSTVSTQPIGSN